jgi:hypothetical protein
MSRRKRAAAAPSRSPSAGPRAASNAPNACLSYRRADPPKPNRKVLVGAAALLALWIVGLLAMAIACGAFRVAQ